MNRTAPNGVDEVHIAIPVVSENSTIWRHKISRKPFEIIFRWNVREKSEGTINLADFWQVGAAAASLNVNFAINQSSCGRIPACPMQVRGSRK